MKNLEAIRTAGQENLNRLVDLGKEQPPEVKTWGVTAGAAVAGGLVVVAGAQGLLAIVATLAFLPVTLTLGAIGGGLLGWRYMEQQKAANKATIVDETPFGDPALAAVAVQVAVPEASSEPLIITPEAVTESQPAVSTATEPVAIEVVAPPARQDNLEDIAGVGPVFATRLQASGIYTFAQLAALNPEQLLEIMATSRGGHLVDAATWIAQAQQLTTSSTG